MSDGFAGRGSGYRRLVSLALAVLVALFQVALTRTPQLGSGFDPAAGTGIYGPLCLAHAEERNGGADAPPGEAPGPGHHDCAACCVAAAGGLAAAVEPPALVGHILYFEPFVYFPRSATVPDVRFASAIRSRAPPILC